jgi:hypothetical protein
MRSAKPGASTSAVELANVSQHGLWLLIDAREHYLPFDVFPWFRDATIRQLSRIERPARDHFYWPELDVDLTLDTIEHPEDYPLECRTRGGRSAGGGRSEGDYRPGHTRQTSMCSGPSR